MGATWPGRWQLWQFFCKTGSTSLLKVTGVEEVVSPASAIAPNTIPRIHVRIILFPFLCLYHDQAGTLPLSENDSADGREMLSIGP